MPAIKSINLRSGDLSEELGIYLLKPYSLIAPVPRTEDVGIDAIVTLLKKYEHGNFIASNSFYLQLKSKSISTVKYDSSAINWLINLGLPLIFGVVEKKEHLIELYATHKLSEYISVTENIKEIILDFNDDFNMQDYSKFENGIISLGPPIISFNISMHNEPDYIDHFHNIINPHIEISRENIETRKIGFINNISWKTNEIPKRGLWKSCLSAKPAGYGFENVDDLMAPYFSIWIDECIRAKDLDTIDDRILLMKNARKMIEMSSVFNIKKN